MAAAAVRSGPGYFFRSYRKMVRWELTSLRLWMPVTFIVQVLVGAGFVLGVGLFYDDIPPTVALYVSTGVAVITLVTMGLVLAPQLIAQQKQAQTYDFLWSLPVPRTMASLAWVTVMALVAIPGMAAALVVAHLRYDLALDLSPRLIPAVLLTILTGSLLGYALAHAIPVPMIAQLVSQLLAFTVMGFAPINYPIDQLPAWLADLNRGLPFYHMGVVVRDGLTSGLVTRVGLSYLVLGAWALVAAAVAALVLGRRG